MRPGPLLDLSFSTQVALYAGFAAGPGHRRVAAFGRRRGQTHRHYPTAQDRRAKSSIVAPGAGSGSPFELLFLAGVLYAYWRLRQQDQILQVTQGTFVDPLFLLAPTIFVAAVALVSLRGLPAIIGLLGRAASRFISVPLWLAITQISRRSGSNRPLLFLLIFTVALGFFSATFAGTLDKALRRRRSATLSVPTWSSRCSGSRRGGAAEQRWRYPPFAVVKSIPGVESATRVLRMPVFADGLEGNV